MSLRSLAQPCPGEIAAGSDPDDPDSTPNDRDGDGFSPEVKIAVDSNSDDPDSTPNDRDGDGFSPEVKIAADSNSDDPDSTPNDRDGDGFSDDEKLAAGLDPDYPSLSPDDALCGKESCGPESSPVFQADGPPPAWEAAPSELAAPLTASTTLEGIHSIGGVASGGAGDPGLPNALGVILGLVLVGLGGPLILIRALAKRRGKHEGAAAEA